MKFLKWLYRHLKSEGARYLAKAGLFAAVVTMVSYWTSYQDSVENRLNTAWDNLRAAITWTEDNPFHYGNVGQIAAIETLTRDCDRWWVNSFLEPVFGLVFHSCVDLKSVILARMELGSLRAPGASFTRADLSCTNLAKANFRHATLTDGSFHGSYMAGADLRGADLTGDSIDLRLANLSWALFDSATKTNASKLKCACINFDTNADGTRAPQVSAAYGPSPDTIKLLSGLKACPAVQNTCDPTVMDNWTCSE
jgi:hypothetical protein